MHFKTKYAHMCSYEQISTKNAMHFFDFHISHAFLTFLFSDQKYVIFGFYFSSRNTSYFLHFTSRAVIKVISAFFSSISDYFCFEQKNGFFLLLILSNKNSRNN